MKKSTNIILVMLILTICIMIPCVSLAGESDGPSKPGFYTDHGYTFFYEEKNGDLVMAKGWQTIGDYRYYFSSKNGHMLKGWQTLNGHRYYFGSKNGHMLKGWQTLNNHRYYFDKENGHMYKGFHKIDGATYYFGKTTGKRLSGWVKRGDSKAYFSKKTGKMLKGKQKVGKHTYYFSKKTGKRLTGWKTLDDHKYYFSKKNGQMFTGVHKIGKNVYTFGDKGRLQRTVYGNKKAICLTFDDGPSEFTPIILKSLKKNDGLATFFVLGYRVTRYPEEAKKEVAAGCQIGNHSRNHEFLSKCSPAEIKDQMLQCKWSLRRNAGTVPHIMRPPFGEVNSKIKENVGYPLILWSVDTLDWKTQNSSMTYDAVMKGAKDGAIILMHDRYRPTAMAAKRIIPALRKKGYQLVTIEEMSLLKNKPLKEGKVYSSF